MTTQRRMLAWMLAMGGLVLVVALLSAAGAAAGPARPDMRSTAAGIGQATEAWNSGWAPINPGATLSFTHNLGGDPDDYVVELLFLDTDAGGVGINRRGYGGLEINGQWLGANWQNLTTNSIEIHRQPDDLYADQVFVWLTVAPSAPPFDSGWLPINPNQVMTITHNLGAPAEDLNVSLWFKSATLGIHNFAYGGLAVDGPHVMLGAHWQNLTSNTVEVYRHPNDTAVEQVRVIVVEPSETAYDSLDDPGGWQNVVAGTAFTFTHNLNWSPLMVLVNGECYDPSGLRGIHQLFAGGNHDWIVGFQGSNLQNLTPNRVSVYRQPQDEFCPQVRVRIWTRGANYVYLPLMAKE